MSSASIKSLEELGAIHQYLHFIEPEYVENTLQQYQQLWMANPSPKNDVLKKYLEEAILPAIAYYRVLKENGEDQHLAIEKVDSCFTALNRKRQRLLRFLGSLPFYYSILRARMTAAMQAFPPEGWRTEWIQNDRQAVRINLHTCFFFETLKANHCPELILVFCKVDDTLYENMSKQVLWKRTQTIGSGAAYCDFCFMKKT